MLFLVTQCPIIDQKSLLATAPSDLQVFLTEMQCKKL